MAVTILTDSGCDLTPAEASRMGIDIVPVWIIAGDKRMRDGVDVDRETIVAQISAGEAVSTEPPSEEEYAAAYRRAKDAGNDVVMISLSSHLSQCYARASAAAKAFSGVHVVDSRSASGSQTLIVEYAKELANAATPAEEIARRVDPARLKTATFFAVPDMTPLGRSGRLPKAIIALGSMLNVSLVLKMNEQGAVGPAGQSFSFEKTCDLMVESFVRWVDRSPRVRVAFSHIRAPQTVARLSALLEEKLGAKPLVEEIREAPPTLAAHLGAGAIGIFAIVP
jgi:DegV family protein with EDD domain